MGAVSRACLDYYFSRTTSRLTLADFPYVTVRIGCSRCARQGKYKLARLAEKHGADINLVDLLSRIAANCPIKERANEPGLERCGALYLDLRGGPAPDESKRSTDWLGPRLVK